MYAAGIAASKRYPGQVIPTIKPRKDLKIIEKARLAEQSGAFAVANDIDAVTSANMRFFGQPLEVKRLENLKHIINSIHLPFIVKGIMSPLAPALPASRCQRNHSQQSRRSYTRWYGQLSVGTSRNFGCRKK